MLVSPSPFGCAGRELGSPCGGWFGLGPKSPVRIASLRLLYLFGQSSWEGRGWLISSLLRIGLNDAFHESLDDLRLSRSLCITKHD